MARASGQPDDTGLCSSSKLFFAAKDSTGSAIWITDGTAGGVRKLSPPSAVSQIVAKMNANSFKGKVFMWISQNGLGLEPYLSDGTKAGTTLLLDINSGAGSSYAGIPYAIVLNNKLYFFAKTSNSSAVRMYVTDGTASGTTQVAGQSDILDFGSFNDKSGAYAFYSSSKVAFAAQSSTYGVEVYSLDSNLDTISLAADLSSGTNSSSPMSFKTGQDSLGNARAFFIRQITYDRDTPPNSLYYLDDSGAHKVTPDLPYVYLGNTWTHALGSLYAGNGTDPYGLCDILITSTVCGVYNGLASGGANRLPPGLGNASSFIASGGMVSPTLAPVSAQYGILNGVPVYSGISSGSYNFAQYGYQLLAYSLNNLNVQLQSAALSPSPYAAAGIPYAAFDGGITFNNKLYFTLNNSYSGSNEMWTSSTSVDSLTKLGTFSLSAGTAYVPGPAVVYNSKVYWTQNTASSSSASSQSWDIIASSGTAATTSKVVTLAAKDAIKSWLVFNGKLYFTVKTATNGAELWVSDGTQAGTVLLKDIQPGVADGIEDLGAALNFL